MFSHYLASIEVPDTWDLGAVCEYCKLPMIVILDFNNIGWKYIGLVYKDFDPSVMLAMVEGLDKPQDYDYQYHAHSHDNMESICRGCYHLHKAEWLDRHEDEFRQIGEMINELPIELPTTLLTAPAP